MSGQPLVLPSPVVGEKLAWNFRYFFLHIGQLDLLLSCMHAFLSLKDAFYHKPEGKIICVCSRTLVAKKSNKPWHKEYRNDMFLSVYLRRLLKSKTIFKKSSILCENGTFMQKTWSVGPLFCLLWPLVRNWLEIFNILFSTLNNGILNCPMKLSLEHKLA